MKREEGSKHSPPKLSTTDYDNISDFLSYRTEKSLLTLTYDTS
jgi:hypothetical protein